MMKIPCVYMRGGTSKGLFFQEKDLPEDKFLWPGIFMRAMGTPDIKQIDGMGGGTSSTSKIAVISPSKRPDADVDYNFFQVDIVIPNVDNTANCGNLLAAVGSFAVEEGLVPAVEPETVVRVFNTNTQKLIEVRVPIENGRLKETGSAKVEGVPGTAAPIHVQFFEPAGTKTGKLFPTGRRRDLFQVPGYGEEEVTLIDCANPVVFVNARTLGIRGTELTELNGDRRVMDHIEAIRGVAAEKLGFVQDWREASFKSTSIPKVGIVSSPQEYKDLGGGINRREQMDLCVRAVSVGAIHKAIPLTVAAATCVAAMLKGTVVNDVTAAHEDTDQIRLGHASGVTTVSAQIEGEDRVMRAGMVRTARRIMDGFVYV